MRIRSVSINCFGLNKLGCKAYFFQQVAVYAMLHMAIFKKSQRSRGGRLRNKTNCLGCLRDENGKNFWGFSLKWTSFKCSFISTLTCFCMWEEHLGRFRKRLLLLLYKGTETANNFTRCHNLFNVAFAVAHLAH